MMCFQGEKGCEMKKTYMKPTMKVYNCDNISLDKNVSDMSEEELLVLLKKCKDYSETKYYANKNYVLREIAGEAVLVTIGDGVADLCGIVNLNESAKVLWSELQQGASREEMQNALIEKFHISNEKAAEDVEKSIKLLEERGMVSHG